MFKKKSGHCMSKRVVFKRAHSHPFCRSFVWNLLTSQRRNMNIWLKVKNQHQGPTFRKLQLEDFFFPPVLIFCQDIYLEKEMFMNVEFAFLHHASFSSQSHFITWRSFFGVGSFGCFIITYWPVSSDVSTVKTWAQVTKLEPR